MLSFFTHQSVIAIDVWFLQVILYFFVETVVTGTVSVVVAGVVAAGVVVLVLVLVVEGSVLLVVVVVVLVVFFSMMIYGVSSVPRIIQLENKSAAAVIKRIVMNFFIKIPRV